MISHTCKHLGLKFGFRVAKLCTVSQLTDGLLHLVEGPSTTDVVCLHLIRTCYNSLESPTSLAECPMNYNREQ
jgi:hypothetical protein